jgi:hypothetical protein
MKQAFSNLSAILMTTMVVASCGGALKITTSSPTRLLKYLNYEIQKRCFPVWASLGLLVFNFTGLVIYCVSLWKAWLQYRTEDARLL